LLRGKIVVSPSIEELHNLSLFKARQIKAAIVEYNYLFISYSVLVNGAILYIDQNGPVTINVGIKGKSIIRCCVLLILRVI